MGKSSEQTQPARQNVWKDGGLVCMARIVGEDRQPTVQASYSGISCKVFNLDTGDEIASPSIDVPTTVFDSLQTNDARWTADTLGYNWRYTVGGSSFPPAGAQYRVVIRLTPASGDTSPVTLAFDGTVIDSLWP